MARFVFTESFLIRYCNCHTK